MKKSLPSSHLVIVALHYIFFVTLLTQRGMGSNLQDVFRFVYPGYIVLVIAGFIAMKGAMCRKNFHIWFHILAYVLLPVMCFRAIRAGEPSWRIIDGATPFLMFSLIFIGSNDRIWPRLNRVFMIHTVITVVLVILEMPSYSAVGRGSFFSGATNMWLYEQLLYGFPFLLLTWKSQGTLGKIIALLGTAAYGLVAILGQYRKMFFLGMVFYIFFAILIFIIEQKKTKKRKRFRLTRNFSMLVIGLMVIIFLSWFILPNSSIKVIEQSFNKLVYRFVEPLSGGAAWKNEPRWREMTLEVLPQIVTSEWLIGRGVAYRYYYLTWDNPRTRKKGKTPHYMVHMTPVHLIMQGGVPLLLMMIIGPVIVGFRSFRRNRDIITLAAAGILIHFFTTFIADGNPENQLWFVLVCLSTGRCVRRRKIPCHAIASHTSPENQSKNRVQENAR
jgi:hypothetical protein